MSTPAPVALVDDVAALFVDARGDYPKHFTHWWDEKRDARTYDLDLPVIAHPPCQRWCRLAGLVEARYGYKRGEDGGTFANALATLRRVGGVLEHPAYSDAWVAFGLPRPPTGGEWVPGAEPHEWTCYVEQWRYGHRAKKATWLYYVGLTPPRALKWGAWRRGMPGGPTHQVSNLGEWRDTEGKLHGGALPGLTAKRAIHTPPEFREALLALARHAVKP